MALSYVRTLELTVHSISVLFNDDINSDVGINNVSITSSVSSVPNPEIKSISIDQDVIDITFSELFPNIQYKIEFISTDTQSFSSSGGEIISEDGNRNSFFLVSPGDDADTIRDGMIEDISTIYETGEQNLVRGLISSMANGLEKALDVTQTVKSANYLSILEEDELKTRGDGPTDKLDNGGAFEIVRVGRDPTGSLRSTSLEFGAARTQNFMVRSSIIVNSVIGSLPADPISIQSIDVVNEKVSDNVQLNNHFSGLTIKVVNYPVIQVISVSLFRNGEYTEYDIERFGYTLQSNRYDTTSASTNVNLDTNEIELSTSSITGGSGGFLLPRAGDVIYISYVYKRAGRDIDSVVLSRVRSVVREPVTPVANNFSLENAPIVTRGDIIPELDGVSFLNAQAVNGQAAFTVAHPAFTNEIPYDVTKIPGRPGEYTVNYNTAEVLVFGEDSLNQGTGEGAPVATYYYREIFTQDLDYTFNSDRDEIAINSTRDLEGIEAKISFDYEDTFADGVDFRTLSHVEVLNERVDNRLISSTQIQTENFPITNVFRILNETTGELYTVDRFNDTSITFTGRQFPRQKDVERERAVFNRVPQEVLLVSDELTNTIGLRIFQITLANEGISDSQGRFVGANFNSSVSFSDIDIFSREFFYEDRLFDSLTTNLNRLKQIGDYIIDYNNGIIYVAVSTGQDTDLGDVSYRHKKIETNNDHILGVDSIYKSQSELQQNISTYIVGDVSDTMAEIDSLEQVGERFINNNSSRVLVVGTYQSGENGITTNGSVRFTAYDGTFSLSDVGRTLVVGSSSDTPVQTVQIVDFVGEHEVDVSPAFSYTKKGRVWKIIDLSSNAAKTLTLNYDIVSVNNIYLVTQLGTLPFSELDGYFNVNTDTIEDNVITLGSSNGLSVGDAVIVDYNYGNIFIDYTYLQDELIVSYEYGNNRLDWSISDALYEDDEYYVTYKYGALRDSLLLNFGSLTQIPQLTTFSTSLDRESYRSILGGTLQSFIEGPTVTSIERLVEAFTNVTPNISETAFNNWVLGRDNLHLRKPIYSSTQTFDLGKFDNGAVFDDDYNIEMPALAHIRLDEGTIETWVRPQWNGLANDASLTFDLSIDGYSNASNVYIGFAGSNPDSVPFTLNAASDESVKGEPSNISDNTGFFIWYDEFAEIWNVRWREHTSNTAEFSGSITTSGEFYNVVKPVGEDGYEINEITDIITSTINAVEFTAQIDGYDTADIDGYGNPIHKYALDGISFTSGDIHYIFDMAEKPATNRISLFKDGTGYLNFQVFDHRANYGLDAGFYNLSTNISDWTASEIHHVAVSWRFNSADEMDEMHMFIDGVEVPNLFKYGGNPKASALFDFGDVAEEIVVESSPSPIYGGFNGSTIAGSTLFSDATADFITAGIQTSSSFYLLDDTDDGISDPNFGTPYTVVGVGTTTLLLDRAPTLTLGNLSYSINQVVTTVTTPVNIQDFIVVALDGYGNETELRGVDAENPDYSVARGSGNTHTLTINNGVSLEDQVIIRPLGLILKRFREKLYVYGENSDEIRLNAAAPTHLDDVRITAFILDTHLIEVTDGYDYNFVNTIIDSQIVTVVRAAFEDMWQPTNQATGKKLAVKLSGSRFDFDVGGNTVTIEGQTYSGAVQEILSFTESGTQITSEFWTAIDRITISTVPIDLSQAPGIAEIKEYVPITISENNGDFADVVEYSNGILKLEIYGTGGEEFSLSERYYEVDYPSFLRIRVDAMPDTFFIGSDYLGENRFDGVLDEFRILTTMSQDTRVGEELVGTRSITTDNNATEEFTSDSSTLLLLHLNNTVEDSATFRDRFNNGYEVAPSVNDNFGTAVKFQSNSPYIVNNAYGVFNNNEGTIEFWLSPLDDSRGDPNYHYYVDLSSFVEEETESTSSINVVTTQRIREVESVRLASDVFNTGVDYFIGGSISNVDRKTITLGTLLPTQSTAVKITYAPLNSQGDRVSIFRDPDGRINFFMKASGTEHLISVPMNWERHTWHRIMAMWRTNSVNNQDRLRLFVDGSERGTIKYGTGLIYGTGVIYGQAEVRPGVNRFLVNNIDLLDTFSKIYIGTDSLGVNNARALMDNLRFSSIERLQSITITSNDTIDVNYFENTSLALPVIEDLNTTALYDFDTTISDVVYKATVVNAERGIFRFKVEVVDSFNRVIGNTYLEGLLEDLINTIKPAHTEAIITFVE